MRGVLQLVRSYGLKSLFFNNFAVVLVVVLTALTLVFALFNNMTKSLIDRSVLEMNQTIVNQTKTVLEETLDESVRIGAAILDNRQTSRFMFLEKESLDSDFIISLSSSIRVYSLIFKYVHSVYVYSEASGTLVSNVYSGDLAAYGDISWMQAYLDAQGHALPTASRLGPSGYPYYMSVVMPYYFYGDEKKGCIVINIDMEQLDKVLANQGNSSQSIYVTDSQGQVLYSTDKSSISKNINSLPGLLSVSGKTDETFFDTLKLSSSEETKQVITVSPLQNRDWRLVSVLPLTAYEEHFNRQKAMTQVLLLALTLLGIAVTLIISVKAYAPLKSLLQGLDKAGMLNKANGINEAEHIKGLVAKAISETRVVQAELDKRLKSLKKAQAAALQTQITPHFLSNTLDAMRWDAMRLTGGKNSVSDMLMNMSALFRLSLDMENMLVKVSDEVEQCKLYLSVMAYRYAGMFTVIWDINPEALECSILKLSLQPILENAIYHGIKLKKAPGTITVRGFVSNGQAVIQVKDDGIGITKEKAEEINENMRSAMSLYGEHVGMRNVNQRLKLIYGESSGVSISSDESGTTVELRFPAI
ncbi:MAG: histidine kinase [Clostridiales bacterium]|jgi:two-component system sensor histidine kinase YesM|nr:histidine kinase [Clostridiales bacterium]